MHDGSQEFNRMSADISGSPTDTEPDISSLKLKTASKQTLDDRNTSNSSSSNLDLSDSTNEVSSEKSFFKNLVEFLELYARAIS